MQPSTPTLPAEGFIRQSDLISTPAVTEKQAEGNRRSGKRPVRPRAARSGPLPFSGATLWRKVKAGEFPAPVKLSAGVTAWRVADVREWLAKAGA